MDNGGTFEEARLKIAAACKRHGVAAGIHANAGLAAKHAAAGYQMITVSGDVGSIAAGAARDLKTVRESAGSVQPVYS
jgi:4-hydroxy-2-oxoheptanedioate aldolase